ncbi:redoxin domain-containing protein [Laspinema sp. D1]|uniref:Redoxin domain-containing protein n=1 Tax=Laspinema palackyanum D2a TaxID=2953684 RepID=A0ABT2MJ99_9CYAN|nr:redoxin domain-containing protein [Laspinema sp. D2a]
MNLPRVRAPEFPSHQPWLNCNSPLSLGQLKGRIVLLDFWTYCCINCLHILPDLKYLEQKYPEHLTVIGVHSAKFENEKETENIRQAILRYDIEHPVIVDQEFEIWQQYAVRAWPTLILIDPLGYVVEMVSGEGKRGELDEAIAQLIAQQQAQGSVSIPDIKSVLEKQKNPIITPLAFPGKVLADTASSRLFIADSGHHRIIVTTLEGTVQSIIGNGTSGFTDGSFSEAQFFGPQGMSWDGNCQCLYVADTENHAIRQIDFTTEQVQTLAGTGTQNRTLGPQGGHGLETPLNSPWDLELIGGELLLIAMAGSHQIWAMDLMDGTVGTYSGIGAEAGIDGELDEAAFAQPSGITTDDEELFVADSEISSIRAIGLGDQPRVRTLCGSGDLFGFGDRDGTAEEALLQHCLGIDYGEGLLWVADTYNHKIKTIHPKTGTCKTILGDGTPGLLDGKNTATRFFEPGGLSIATGILFIADTNNHRIRQVALDTLTVTTLEFPGLCAPGFCVPENSAKN